MENFRIFVLIHGTWSSIKIWQRRRCPYRVELLTSFPQSRIFRFPWRSGNQLAARAEAGLRLAKQIRRLASWHPNARFVLIGHSHGGTVAQYALADEFVRDKVDSLICLGTPFLRFRSRDVTQWEFAILPLFYAAIALSIGLEIYLYDHRYPPLYQFLAIGWLIPLVIVSQLLGTRMSNAWNRWIGDAARKAVGQFVVPKVDTRMFCAYVSHDEARYVVTGSIWIADLPLRLFSLFLKISVWSFAIGSALMLIDLIGAAAPATIVATVFESFVQMLGVVLDVNLLSTTPSAAKIVERLTIALLQLAAYNVVLSSVALIAYLLIGGGNPVNIVSFGWRTLSQLLSLSMRTGFVPEEIGPHITLFQFRPETFPFHSAFWKSSTLCRIVVAWLSGAPIHARAAQKPWGRSLRILFQIVLVMALVGYVTVRALQSIQSVP